MEKSASINHMDSSYSNSSGSVSITKEPNNHSNHSFGLSGMSFSEKSSENHSNNVSSGNSSSLNCSSVSIPPLINHKNECYNHYKKKIGKMSFVGIALHENYYIVFADSKSTRIPGNGALCRDETRKPINKIIIWPGWAGAAFNANTIEYTENNTMKSEYIEDWISFRRFNDPYIMADELQYYLRDKKLFDDKAEYCFLFAKKSGADNIVLYLNISRERMESKRWFYRNEEVVMGGDDNYINHFSFSPFLLLSESEDEVKKNLEGVIRWRDGHYNAYQTVGIPVFVKKIVF